MYPTQFRNFFFLKYRVIMPSLCKYNFLLDRLVYTPDIDWFGEEIIPIVLVDNPVHIQPTSSKVTITITVEDVTDVPVIFLTSMGQSILLADPTEPIAVSLSILNFMIF